MDRLHVHARIYSVCVPYTHDARVRRIHACTSHDTPQIQRGDRDSPSRAARGVKTGTHSTRSRVSTAPPRNLLHPSIPCTSQDTSPWSSHVRQSTQSVKPPFAHAIVSSMNWKAIRRAVCFDSIRSCVFGPPKYSEVVCHMSLQFFSPPLEHQAETHIRFSPPAPDRSLRENRGADITSATVFLEKYSISHT